MQGHKLVEKYALLERVAEGSYGEIYKAQDRHSKQLVAVKRFKGAPKIGLPTSFVREHYILTVLGGKAIPRVLDVFSNEEPPTIVMQWLTMSIQQLLKSRKKYAIKEFFHELVLAIDSLHSQEVIHRDMKPANIMLGCKGGPLAEPLEITPQTYQLKIIDFGMAREQAWQNRDMTNQVGTLYYRAPELLLGTKRYDSKVDIWALGCIFYFMQTGSLLFKASNELEQFKSIVTILGSDISKIKNQGVKEGLVTLKMELVPQGWSMVEKHINEIEFDFLKKMIVLDPDSRLSCKQLLLHPYFIL